MRKTVVLCIAAVVLAGCRPANLESVPVTVVNPNPGKRHVDFLEFKATLQPYSSKASLDLETMTKVVWNVGDSVLVCGDGKEAIYCAVSGGKDTTTLVRVCGDTLSTEQGQIFSAYYPVRYKTEGLDSYIYYKSADELGSVPIKAVGGRTLDFQNACGVVYCVYAPSDDILVKQIVLSSDTDLSPDHTVTIDYTAFSPKGMNLYADKATSFAFFAEEGSYSNFKVELYNETLLESAVAPFAINVANNQVTTVDFNGDGNGINLSKSGTANCYAISESGDYYFTPTYGCSSVPVEGAVDVKVLWEMDNNEVAPEESIFSNLMYEGGKIYFSTQKEYRIGNALIALVDENDTVLWSWHIWAGDRKLKTQKYDAFGRYVMLDRSLGSLSCINSTHTSENKFAPAVLFQWGRKDPFPGQTTQGDRNLVAVRGVERTFAEGPVSIEESVKNPTVFYVGGAEWCTDPRADMWDSTEKSIYDPCPVGYIVPPQAVFSESADIFYPNFAGEECKTKSGCYFFVYDSKYYSYPFSAYYDGMSGDKMGRAENIMWNDSFGESACMACRMWYANKMPHVDADYSMNRSNAASVRCMKIQ